MSSLNRQVGLKKGPGRNFSWRQCVFLRLSSLQQRRIPEVDSLERICFISGFQSFSPWSSGFIAQAHGKAEAWWRKEGHDIQTLFTSCPPGGARAKILPSKAHLQQFTTTTLTSPVPHPPKSWF